MGKIINIIEGHLKICNNGETCQICENEDFISKDVDFPKIN